jgi:hypothetical protein
MLGVLAFAAFVWMVYWLYKWNKGNMTPPPDDEGPSGGGGGQDDYPLPPFPRGGGGVPHHVPYEWVEEHVRWTIKKELDDNDSKPGDPSEIRPQ